MTHPKLFLNSIGLIVPRDCLTISNDTEKAKALLKEWILYGSQSSIPQFSKCTETIQNWLPGILNFFDTSVTKGFTEGCNNKN